MSGSDHPGQSDADPSAPPRPRPWWFTTAAFAAGIVVGVIAVGLLSFSVPDFSTSSTRPGRPAGPAASSSVEVVAQAQVNAACLRVINEAQDVYGALTGLDDAVTDVDLEALDDIVRRLQPIEPRLERDLRACQVTVGASGVPSGSTSAVVPRPSASPTR